MGRWTRHRFGANKNQGSNWIHKPRRLALYARDKFRCVYCGAGPEDGDGVLLTLDHLIPRGSEGSTHANENLVTACFDCNSTKQNLSQRQWHAHLVEKQIAPRGIGLRVRAAIRRRAYPHVGRQLNDARIEGATMIELAKLARRLMKAPKKTAEIDPFAEAAA